MGVFTMLERTVGLDLTVQMPYKLQEQAKLLAMDRKKTISEIVCMALAYYIDGSQKPAQPAKPELSLEQGHHLMRELGSGLGYSTSSDAARNHDLYLYEK